MPVDPIRLNDTFTLAGVYVRKPLWRRIVFFWQLPHTGELQTFKVTHIV